MTKLAEKEKAIELRIQDRMSFNEILEILNVSKSTLSLWLKEFPLSDGELKIRRQRNALKSAKVRRRNNEVVRSKLFDTFGDVKDCCKGKVAEAAVLLRLSLLGYEVYTSVFDGDKVDWIVLVNDKTLKLQVKWASHKKHGNPIVKIQCSNGRNKYRKYEDGELDILVGYDYISDSCYVWLWEEIKDYKNKTVSSESLERWDKLL